MNPVIECENLFKRYGEGSRAVDALKGLDLSVNQGECFGLLGPNGAGKTTTVEILEGLLTPTSGQVSVLGMQWGAGRNREIRRRIGITLQETRFQDKLSCREILTLFRSFYDKGIQPIEALAMVSLQEKSSAWTKNLSGGQRQRLAIACALIGDPDLLFLDEPTTGLDPQARRKLWDVISSFKERGRTILLTTHYMDEAEKLCDRVAIVDHGRVIALGSPAQLVARLGGEHAIEFSLAETRGDQDPLKEEDFLRIEGVTGCVQESDGYLLTVTKPHRSIPSLMELLRTEKQRMNRLTTRHVNLEDVFVSLTGRHLRDD
jgi:ABC-2 type transport system ATP-binding protein